MWHIIVAVKIIALLVHHIRANDCLAAHRGSTKAIHYMLASCNEPFCALRITRGGTTNDTAIEEYHCFEELGANSTLKKDDCNQTEFCHESSQTSIICCCTGRLCNQQMNLLNYDPIYRKGIKDFANLKPTSQQNVITAANPVIVITTKFTTTTTTKPKTVPGQIKAEGTDAPYLVQTTTTEGSASIGYLCWRITILIIIYCIFTF